MIDIECTTPDAGITWVARSEGREGRGTDCIGHLLRAVYDPGRLDGPWRVLDAAGRETARGPSYRYRAARVLREGDGGFSWGWWARHPMGAENPDLEALVAARRTIAKKEA